METTNTQTKGNTMKSQYEADMLAQFGPVRSTSLEQLEAEFNTPDTPETEAQFELNAGDDQNGWQFDSRQSLQDDADYELYCENEGQPIDDAHAARLAAADRRSEL